MRTTNSPHSPTYLGRVGYWPGQIDCKSFAIVCIGMVRWASPLKRRGVASCSMHRRRTSPHSHVLDSATLWHLTCRTCLAVALLIGTVRLTTRYYQPSTCCLNSTVEPYIYLVLCGFIVDERLTFSDQTSSLSKSCYSHIRELCCRYVLTLTLKQPVPSLPLSSTLNLTTVTLSTTIFLISNKPPPADSELSCTYCG